MTRDYGVGSDTVTPVALEGGHPLIQKSGTILSGEDLAKGAVLAEDSDGKLVGLDLEVVIADEELVADAGGSATVFEGFLANEGIIPGSVTIKATVGAAAKDMTDDGKGGLAGSGVGIGFIDYASGYYRLIYDTAPDISTSIDADYTHDVDGKAVPVGVLPEAVDASGGDEPASYIAHGELYLTALGWPASITAAHKARAIKALAQAGIFAKAITGA